MALYGIDISKWQSTSAVDLAKDFCIMKATEGVGYVDPTCDTKYQYAKSKGKLVGVYHFARPDQTGAVAEADFFVDNTMGYWKAKEAILVLDWEAGNTRDVNWALAFLRRVRDKTGIKPLIYMSASVIRSADWSQVVREDFGLWVAGYPNKYNVANPPTPAEGEMPYDISPWSFAAIWQYTSSAGTLDRDIANMDRNAWGKYAGKVDAPAPVITTKDVTTVDDVIPFTTERKDDPTLPVGQEIEVVKGVNGRHTVVYTITYADGKESSRVLKSDVTVNPINQVIRVGTKQPTIPDPEVPEVPETPEVPDTPEVPETPDVPETPETPTKPNWLVVLVLKLISFITSKFNKGK